MKVLQHPSFRKWLFGLRDLQAKARIVQRLQRLTEGHWGDIKSVGKGVSELRIFVGKGYRVYFTKQGHDVVILLCGGNKGSQVRDIEQAHRLALELENE